MKNRNSASPRAALVSAALLTVCAALAVVTLDLRSTRHYVKQFPFKVETASREGEALVLLSSSAQGWTGSRLGEWATAVGVAFGVVIDIPEPLTGTVTLVRLLDAGRGGGSLVAGREVVAKLPPAGSLLAEGGELFYALEPYGGDELVEEEFEGFDFAAGAAAGRAWRWDGESFVALGADESAQLVARARERALKRHARTPQERGAGAPEGGWKLTQKYISASSDLGSLDLRGGRWALRSEGFINPAAGSGTLSLRLVNERSREGETLVRTHGGWAEVSRAQYKELRDENFNVLAGQYVGPRPAPNAATLTAGLLFALLLPYFLLRHSLVRSIGQAMSYPDASPEHFPNLDRDALARYTSELEARGFVRLREYTVVSSSNVPPTRPLVFARLFAHTELRLFAELGQIFGAEDAAISTGLSCAVFTTFEEGWTLCVTDREPNPVIYALRRPKALWLSRPGARLEELIEWHTDLRGQMVEVLDLRVIEDVRAEVFLRCSSESVEEMRRVMQKRGRLLLPFLFEHSRVSARPRHEWLGDYGLRAPYGWSPPAASGREGESGIGRARAAVANWVGVTNFVGNVLIAMSVVLLLFSYNPARGALYFRLALSVGGLALVYLPRLVGARKGAAVR
ncbi:MAG TPA: hypothetical protein VD968_00305 [Pyrinomonadaceae bacterium]|nr:hypothetical protein [Pyrinomonadaceae bacterium]